MRKDDGVNERLFAERVREAAAAATALPAPADAWARIAMRVRSDEAVLLPTDAPSRGRLGNAPRRLRVAGVALLLGATGAAAGLRGSPVRQWLAEVLAPRKAADAPSVTTDPTAGAGTPTASTAPETTLVLEPANGAIIVALEAPAPQLSLLVRFAESGDPEVRATGAAAGAQFRSAAGRLTVAHAGGGGLVLTIPRTLARVRVEVDGEAYLTKENGQIRILAPAADTVGSEILLQIRR